MGKDWPTVAQCVDRWEDCLRRGGWSVTRYILSYGVHRAQGVYADWPRRTELQVLVMARAILARATFAEEHILDDLLWEWMDDQDQDRARDMELPSGTIAEWIASGKPDPGRPERGCGWTYKKVGFYRASTWPLRPMHVSPAQERARVPLTARVRARGGPHDGQIRGADDRRRSEN